MTTEETIFLTGFPGFIAGRLIERLAADGARFLLLVQPAFVARARATSIFHLAAVYDLGVERELAMRVNLGGTRTINEFARSVKSLRRYHYVSTCYVAGRRAGVIREDE